MLKSHCLKPLHIEIPYIFYDVFYVFGRTANKASWSGSNTPENGKASRARGLKKYFDTPHG
ncbi:MAG: hypothetical protein HQK94_19490 [Nitrospirae bacterium]|nr:hypothetical protein [Nitrospirota bacterium]